MPEAVEEKDRRESEVAPGETEFVSRRSGSETLAPSQSIAAEEKTTPDSLLPVDELKLDLGKEELPPPLAPTVTLQEPTPDVLTERRSYKRRPIPEEVILSPSPPAEPQHAHHELTVDGDRFNHRTASYSRSPSISPSTRPADRPSRRRSITDSANAQIVNTLIDAPAKRHGHEHPQSASTALPTSAAIDYFTPGLPNMASMLHRKIWVRRPGASATLVQIKEDDLVDDVRDMILRKYANSLGRTFDSPDMTLVISQRADHGQPRHERVLGPEEDMCRTIDAYYPGGQTVEEALTIGVPQKHTPRPSPKPYQSNQSYHALDEYRPLENGTDYFPPMPAIVPPSIPQTTGSHESRASQHAHHPSIAPPLDPHTRSISILNTGQLPPLPSPGGTRRHREHRPKYQRQHTSSPTIVSHASTQGPIAVNPPNLNPAHPLIHPLVHRASTRPRIDSSASDAHVLPNGAPVPPALPTPPLPAEGPPTNKPNGSSPPTPSQGATSSRRPATRPHKSRKATPPKPTSRTRGGHQRDDSQPTNGGGATALTANSMLDGSVPPINVLIVEDNIINLRILEGLMKRLKVRWQTAMNGQIAVDKWRKGGFHLVLMDIQMPVMNGLAATKEIRRLERVNGIGVFSSMESPKAVDGEEVGKEGVEDGEAATTDGVENGAPAAAVAKKAVGASDDKLVVTDGLFKSPIIIVALTASSLQSDRHEALAAGCNDFLTKPVSFVWLERKVKEWGCMQALIDFDGWRKWKDLAAKEEAGKSEEERRVEQEKEENRRKKMERLAVLQERSRVKVREEEERKRRVAMGEVGGGGKGEAGPVAAKGEVLVAEEGKATQGVAAAGGTEE